MGGRCKKCRIKSAAKRSKIHPESKCKKSARYKKYYKTHKADINARSADRVRKFKAPIIEKQNGKCANPNCLTVLTAQNSHVDHDHKIHPNSDHYCEKCVRGVLCRFCNVALGQVEDSIPRLEGLIQYLRIFAKV